MSWGIDPEDYIEEEQQHDFQEYWLSSYEYWINWFFKTSVDPLLVLIGTAANVVVFLAFRRHDCVPPSMRLYMMAFTIVNILSLYFGCGLEWVAHITDCRAIIVLYDWFCKVAQLALNVITFSPYWIMLIVVIDRSVFALCRKEAETFCTRFVAKIMVGVAHICLLFISIHALWTYERDPYCGLCNIDPMQHYFSTVRLPWVAAVLYCYAPLFFILVLVFVILVGLRMTSYASATAAASVSLVPSRAPACCGDEHDADELVAPSAGLATAFVLLTAPAASLGVLELFFPLAWETYQRYTWYYLATVVCRRLVYVNQSIVPIIYYTCVPGLRGGGGCGKSSRGHDDEM